jgi:hypothetical protein
MYTGIRETDNFMALKIYPNPFTEKVSFEYTLAEPSPVWMTIFNVQGETVRMLVDGQHLGRGSHTTELPAGGLRPGIYYCRFEIPGHIEVRKIILAK